MNLTKQQTKRIDDFLIRLGFEYLDIRYEMVDHIASDIEDKFEDLTTFFERDRKYGSTFLKYMLGRKNELENSYRKQSKSKARNNYLTIFKEIGKLLIKKETLLSLIIAFLTVKYMSAINAKTSYITLICISFLLFLVKAYFIYKTQGSNKSSKLRIVQSYYFTSTIFFYIITQLPINFLSIFTRDRIVEQGYSYFALSISVIQVLVLLSFISQKETIKIKYKHLITN